MERHKRVNTEPHTLESALTAPPTVQVTLRYGGGGWGSSARPLSPQKNLHEDMAMHKHTELNRK